MKQLLIKKGNILIEEVPPPAYAANEVLIATHVSLISTGTELAGLTSSSSSMLTRALKQPHNVAKAMKMAREKGFVKTYKIIKGLLDFGTPSGYSLAGEVIAVGASIQDLKIGDLVTASGAGVANHAECVAVPRLLVTKIPAGVSMEDAASVTLGAIAMQGVRQADLRMGETVAVIGLGLLGQLTIQMLKNAGCRVIGIEPDESRRALAVSLGADLCFSLGSEADVARVTEGFGVDCTIITASTESDAPLKSAMEMTRKRGTVVVVGAVGLHMQRSPWYEKEIDLRISCSYGPGRYDASYEQEGVDYPLPYVRWTENRNMEEYLRLLQNGRVKFGALAPKEFKVEDAAAAYEHLKQEKPLAVLLRYEGKKMQASSRVAVTQWKSHPGDKRLTIGMIGAGSFAATMHLPNLEKLKKLWRIKAVATKHGTTAKQHAVRYDAEYCTTDYTELLNDKDLDAVLIATRHSMHAELVLEALKAGKAVFVEKPLATTQDQLNTIKEYFENAKNPPLLFVGFNRRFSPHVQRIKKLTENRTNPMIVTYRVNAGYLPKDHWTQQPEEGGRIIGEGCHFIDVFNYLTGAKPVKIESQSIAPHNQYYLAEDNIVATLRYSDGSVCNLIYTALGNRDLSKEYMEVFCDGRAYVLDDYKTLSVKGAHGGSMKSLTQDKGHLAELEAFAHGIHTGVAPISLEDMFSVTEASFVCAGAL